MRRLSAISPEKAASSSRGSDDIFEDAFAERWIKAMGTYGDPIRASIVNPVVAFAADYFVANPLQPQNRSPRNLIQQALHCVAPELARANYEPSNQPLHQWHADTKRLSDLYPNVKQAVVWDLGCGEGYLGRWLATQGAKCVGVEPSKTLFRYAKAKASRSTRLFPYTINAFLEGHAHHSLNPAPSLVTLIAVLDGCSDADSVLDRINAFMREHHLEVPLLLTTFDPDFFCAGLPRNPVNKGTIRIFDTDHPFIMRDPAEWEITFTDHNFHVLDQRPIHLDTFPPKLSDYILKLCRDQILYASNTVDLIAPRQGPFYLWIIAPRLRIRGQSSRSPALKAGPPKETIAFDQGEVIEVKGNLGSKVYELLEGSAQFDYAGLFQMTFSQGMFFGQMEVNQNYFASRMLGPIIAQGKTIAQTFQLAAIARMDHTDDLARQLFVSMIGHLDSVSYTRLLSGKYVKGSSHSQALPTAPLTNVRNCSAVILNLCARTSPRRAEGYKSRLLIELSHDHLQTIIYHNTLKRRNTGLMDTLALMVQSSIIDCFSAKSFARFVEDDGIQEDIADIDDDKLTHEPFLHLGLIAVHYLRRAIGEPAASIDVREIAVAISALLGNKKDQLELKEIAKSIAESEQRDQDQQRERGFMKAQSYGSRKRTAGLRTEEDRRNYVIDRIDSEVAGRLPSQMREKIWEFLIQLHNEFNFHDKQPYATNGLSKFVVVRDVWALLACAMDDKLIWTSNKKVRRMNEFVKLPEQRHRLIAYYYECVAHIGEKCGLIA